MFSSPQLFTVLLQIFFCIPFWRNIRSDVSSILNMINDIIGRIYCHWNDLQKLYAVCAVGVLV